MRITPVLVLLSPVLLAAQGLAPLAGTAPEKPYRDGTFALGAKEGSPAPTVAEKFRIHAYRIVPPRIFIGYLFAAGIQQAQNSPGAWGRGFDGYAKRYGSDFSINAIREISGFGINSATHLDPRFFRSDKTDFKGRAKDAVRQVLIAHTDSGGRSFAYGNVFSAYAATLAATRWLPQRQSSVGDGLITGSVLLAGTAGLNVAREFWPDIRRKIRHK